MMRKSIDRLQSGKVDCAAEHFELSFESSNDVSTLVALLGRPEAGVMNFELLVPRNATNAGSIASIEREIQCYFFELNERDPWGYAQYHCGSAANVYSKVHWSFRKGSGARLPAVLKETVLEVGGEGGSITLLREKTADGKERFRVATDESIFDDDEKLGEISTGPAVPVYAASFRSGVVLLDKYPWARLSPTEVHPRYLTRVLKEVEKRGGPTVAALWLEELAHGKRRRPAAME